MGANLPIATHSNPEIDVADGSLPLVAIDCLTCDDMGEVTELWSGQFGTMLCPDCRGNQYCSRR